MDLKEKSEFTILIEMNSFIDAAGNVTDTTITRKLNTISELEFSGASGTVRTNNNEKVDVILRELGKTNNDIKVTANNKIFSFDRVIPGKYLLWAYIDSDSNNSYSYGSIEPKSYSEDFLFFADTLNLRARWPVGDIELNFTK